MEKKKFKILSIDGGGIKGLYSAQVLAKFESEFHVVLSDCFDMICGTSTGGIIALAASLKIPMDEVVGFYQENGPLIFNEKFKSRKFCKRIARHYLRFKQAVRGGKYNSKQLEVALSNVFGTRKIGESNNFLCIPAYSTLSARPRVFKKDYGRLTEDDKKSYVEVALATAAAPTYLPVVEIDDDQLIDGGVWANNPSLVGLFEYLYNFADNDRFDGVEILSISSCEKPTAERHHKKERSFIDWSGTLFDIYSVGQSQFANALIMRLKDFLKFDLRFYRVANKPLSEEQNQIIDMDNASPESLKLLRHIANDTARNEKMKTEVIQFFQTRKSINPSEY